VSRVGGQLAAARRRATDRPHLFHIDAAGTVRGLAEPRPAQATQSTQPWERIGLPQADGLPFGTDLHPPGALATGYRRRGAQFDLFTVDRDGMLRVYSAVENGPWTADVVPEATGIPPGAGLATGYQRGGAVLNVFAAGRAGELLMFQCPGGERWRTAALPLDGVLPHGANVATAYQAETGALAVFAVTKDGMLQILTEVPGGGWLSYSHNETQLPPGAPLATGYSGGGSIPSAFAVSEDGLLCEVRATSIGWSLHTLPGGGLRAPAVVATGYQDGGRQLLAYVVDDAGRLRQYALQPDGTWSVGLVPGGVDLPPGAPLAVGYRRGGAALDLFALPGFSAPPVRFSAEDGRWTGPHSV
jgi:hypothetical protein